MSCIVALHEEEIIIINNSTSFLLPPSAAVAVCELVSVEFTNGNEFSQFGATDGAHPFIEVPTSN